MFSSAMLSRGQDVDLRNCSFSCTSNDITIIGFTLVDATTGLPISNSVSQCQDGETFQVKLEMTYKFNAAATRYNSRFQGLLKIGNTEVFINQYVGTFNSTSTETKLIVYDTFTWECGTNLSIINPQFFWRPNEGGAALESTYVCNDYSNSKCSGSAGTVLVNVPIELPVVWHDFSISTSPDQKNTSLIWSTLKEWQSSHFEIERSVNQADRFEIIDSIPAAGYSFEVKNYRFIDNQIPNNSTRVYYRVKQVDLDGSFDFSKVVMANVNTIVEGTSSWRLFPNPLLDDNLKVSLQNPSAYQGEEIYVRLITSQTSYLHSIPICPDPYNIDLSPITKNIPTGLFLVEISWGDRVETFKIIKR